ncbi:MAG: hypothetical protein PHT95_05320 [Candidatus Omnitrophica bacterium]|nr:hypothetical protein [Candidatus Omnitrophota bacterium]
MDKCEEAPDKPTVEEINKELLAACKAALLELSGINNGPECKLLNEVIKKAEAANA